VVVNLPGHEHDGQDMPNCNRKLTLIQGVWSVVNT
jgi:ATP phosphoribosyltransferase regulatory subunit